MQYLIVVFIIGMLVFIHELGHFLAARAAGIPIDVFSLGFGPALWKKRMGATEYRISLVPVGGYVLPAVADEREFFRIPVRGRMVFSLGGPAANALLAFALLAVAGAMQSGASLFSLVVGPLAQSYAMVKAIAAGLAGLFSRPEGMSGVVGIVHQGSAFVATLPAAIRFTAVLSLNLAIFNMLPLPVLDGGKMLLYLLEKINRRFTRCFVPLTVAGWLVILGLMVYATYLDIGKLG